MKRLLVIISVLVSVASFAQVTVVNTTPQSTKVDTSKNKTISVKKNVKVAKPNSCSEVKYISGLYYSKKDTSKLYTGDCEEFWSDGSLRAYYKYDKGTITFIQRYDQQGHCIQQWGTKKEIGDLFAH